MNDVKRIYIISMVENKAKNGNKLEIEKSKSFVESCV